MVSFRVRLGLGLELTLTLTLNLTQPHLATRFQSPLAVSTHLRRKRNQAFIEHPGIPGTPEAGIYTALYLIHVVRTSSCNNRSSSHILKESIIYLIVKRSVVVTTFQR